MTFPALKALRIGCAGVGRAGKLHIELLQEAKDALIVAVCTPDSAERAWAKRVVPDAAIYHSYDDFIQHGKRNEEENMDAVWLSTPTGLHKDHFTKALHAGKHVFCEKPLSHSPKHAEEMYMEAIRHPELKTACAFPRRFDAGYVAARARIAQGIIGEVLMLRSQTTDLIDRSDFFMQYAKGSGGIFVDSAIHDIDACLYLMGKNKTEDGTKTELRNPRPTRAYATGSTRVFPRFAEWGDADNALGLVDFDDGTIANFRCSRTNIHGHHSFTEVIGTKGRIVINGAPSLRNIEISDEQGTRIEAARDHFDLFQDAFKTEVRAFLDWVLYGKVPDFNMRDAAVAVTVGEALQKSLRSGRHVDIGSEKAKL